MNSINSITKIALFCSTITTLCTRNDIDVRISSSNREPFILFEFDRPRALLCNRQHVNYLDILDAKVDIEDFAALFFKDACRTLLNN